MKKIHKLLMIVTVIAFLFACSDEFLDVKPKGALDVATLATADGIDALLIGAYSLVDGTAGMGFGWESASSNWVFASIRGMEGNKGTDSGDQPDINPLQTFSEAATNPYLNVKWRQVYEAISRTNSVILVTESALADGVITQAEADSFTQQARLLRGWFHFEAWRMWAKVPYVDETTDQTTLKNDSNIGGFIIADMEAGLSLPSDMGQVGRFNLSVAQVMVAKAEMQINGNYTKALGLLNTVKSSGTNPVGQSASLEPNFGDVFSISNRNGVESIYTIQYSVNDGSGGWNGGWGEVLNFPYKSGASPGGCCGFFQPTQEFVNSFRTSGGIPLLDGSYNSDPVLNDQGLAIDDMSYVEDPGPLDPRLDWTVGRRGIPYLDWGDHTGQDWIRDQSYAGPFSPKKQVYLLSDQGATTEVGNWTSGWTANGYRLIRYADVLLMLAESQIQTGDMSGAMININLVRARAADPNGFVKEADGSTNAASYNIREYTAAEWGSSVDPMTALMMERKLELGMEGHRWFDLNRWGVTVNELNRVLTYEKTQQWGSSAYGSAVVGPEDITYPIPDRQIDLSNGNLTQNR